MFRGNDWFLFSLGEELVRGFYSSFHFEFELRCLAFFVSGRYVLSRRVLFLFVDALLSYAGVPCSDGFDEVFPVLRFLVGRFSLLRREWRESVVAFLANRVLGLGNVPEFRVGSYVEFACLKRQVESLLGVRVIDDVVFREVLVRVSRFGLGSVPGFVIGVL